MMTYVFGNCLIPSEYSFFPFYFEALGFFPDKELVYIFIPMIICSVVFALLGNKLNQRYSDF